MGIWCGRFHTPNRMLKILTNVRDIENFSASWIHRSASHAQTKKFLVALYIKEKQQCRIILFIMLRQFHKRKQIWGTCTWHLVEMTAATYEGAGTQHWKVLWILQDVTRDTWTCFHLYYYILLYIIQYCMYMVAKTKTCVCQGQMTSIQQSVKSLLVQCWLKCALNCFSSTCTCMNNIISAWYGCKRWYDCSLF